MKKIAGTCYIKVDGDQLELEGGITTNMTEVTRETLMGVNGVAGFKEMAKAPFIKGSFFVPAGFPLEKLRTGVNMTVTAELANGMTRVLSGAAVIGDPEIDSDKGTVELEFNGEAGKWI